MKDIQGYWPPRQSEKINPDGSKTYYLGVLFKDSVYADRGLGFALFYIHFDTLFLGKFDRRGPVKGEVVPFRIVQLNKKTLKFVGMLADSLHPFGNHDTIVYTREKQTFEEPYSSSCN